VLAKVILTGAGNSLLSRRRLVSGSKKHGRQRGAAVEGVKVDQFDRSRNFYLENERKVVNSVDLPALAGLGKSHFASRSIVGEVGDRSLRDLTPNIESIRRDAKSRSTPEPENSTDVGDHDTRRGCLFAFFHESGVLHSTGL
jgi:hypothetical protein